MQLARMPIVALVAAMADKREPLRQWLRAMARTKSMTLSEIAAQAEVSQTSITRFVNNPEYKFDLSRGTIEKLETWSGMRAPTSRTFEDSGQADYQQAPQKQGKTTLKSRDVVMAPDNSLDLRGVRQGDLCEVAAGIDPQPGDLVQAELRAGLKSRETAIRIFDPPYLMAHSTDYDLNRPILIEPGRARVVGVITKVTRQTREA